MIGLKGALSVRGKECFISPSSFTDSGLGTRNSGLDFSFLDISSERITRQVLPQSAALRGHHRGFRWFGALARTSSVRCAEVGFFGTGTELSFADAPGLDGQIKEFVKLSTGYLREYLSLY